MAALAFVSLWLETLAGKVLVKRAISNNRNFGVFVETGRNWLLWGEQSTRLPDEFSIRQVSESACSLERFPYKISHFNMGAFHASEKREAAIKVETMDTHKLC